MHTAADRIRNVALVGHRGAGKTSLFEALLFEAGVIGRLGAVADGNTTSDNEPDERARQMSISAALSSLEWSGRKVNLLDTPGEPSFVADALGALRVCESAIFVVNGVMGVEVSTARLWARAAELDIARLLFVNMLDRERADFFRALEQLKAAFGQHVVATEIPIGSEHELAGVIDLVDMKAYRQDSAERGGWSETEIPAAHAEQARAYREKLMDEVAEVSDALMERYLEGEEISHEEIVGALKEGTNHGRIFPVVCGVATRNLGTSRLLDAIVEDLPSPVKHGALTVGELELAPAEDRELYAYVFKTRADPFAGRINLFRVYQGALRHDSHVLNTRAHLKERIGQLLTFAGKEAVHVEEFGPGDIGAVAKLKETRSGDWLAARDEPIELPALKLPAPVMAFAIEAASRGDEDKVFTALRRLQEEDPTIDLHRDAQTGEQIVAGLSQVHVEVIVDRLRERFGVEVSLKPPRVPYQETIRGCAKAHGRHKKQSGGRGQFGDCHIEIEPLGDAATHSDPAARGGSAAQSERAENGRPTSHADDHADLEFVNQIKGGVIPSSFIPAVEKGVREAMAAGVLAGYPVKGVRVRLVDGSYHAVDSSEIAFKLAGVAAMRDALEHAEPVLLEPIMLVTVSVPEECVGDVIGDLNSRRGHPLGMEPSGALTEIKAEAPMAEMLSYAPDLRSITGGQGDYTLELLRYEEVPAHLAQKLVGQAGVQRTAAHA
ncbi:MAG TPA: elongation factor G [Solirubrobacteraceae bacterium]|jgi:elongation factor G|nr:elongation factor G [Solirubrobacteraceae bacterium]